MSLNNQNINNETEYEQLNEDTPLNNKSSTTSNQTIEYTLQTTTFDMYKGLVFMFISCVLKSLFSFISKLILLKYTFITSFHLLAVKVYIMIFICGAFIYVLYLYNPNSINDIKRTSFKNILFVSFRSIMSIIATSLTIMSLKYMPISDVYAIYYLYPGIIIIFSYCLINEKSSFFDYICFISCFIGVLCVIRPQLFTFTSTNNDNMQTYIYNLLICCVILSAVFKALEDMIIRHIGRNIHFIIIPLLYCLLGLVLYPIPLMIFCSDGVNAFRFIDMKGWVLIILLACLSFCYTILLALSFQNESAGRASMINYLQVLFMFLADIYVFERRTVLLDYIGICLIFCFNFVNGAIKFYKRNKGLQKFKSVNSKMMLNKDDAPENENEKEEVEIEMIKNN
jgi:drug/metabolite transporter (DMT)-like permease